jgi:RimJ/RimL family protein N-acetyltransferase
MKIANLRLLQAERPEISRVITYNAEVNGPMIAVNETLGFRAVECLGEFQKRI